MDKFTTDGKFDMGKFNNAFEIDKQKQTDELKIYEKKKLDQLNNSNYVKPLYESTIFEILVGVKNTWFSLLDDVLHLNFTPDIITKENRIFFIGVTIVIMVFTIYLFDYILSEDYEEYDEDYKTYLKVKRMIKTNELT